MSQRRIKSLKTAADWQPLPKSLEAAFNQVEQQRPAYFDDGPNVVHAVANGRRRKAR